MPEEFVGKVEILNADSVPTIRLDGRDGNITVWRDVGGTPQLAASFVASHALLVIGSNGQEGGIGVKSRDGRTTVVIGGENGALRIGTSGHAGEIYVTDDVGRDVLHLGHQDAGLYLGARDNAGYIIVRDNAGEYACHIDARSARLDLGTSDNAGGISVKDGAGRSAFSVAGTNASLTLGAGDNAGSIVVKDGTGSPVFFFSAQSAALRIGENGNAGKITVRNEAGDDAFRVTGKGDITALRRSNGTNCEVIRVDESQATLDLGAGSGQGHIRVRDDQGRPVLEANGKEAKLTIGALGNSGRLFAQNAAGNDAFRLFAGDRHALLYLGARDCPGMILIEDKTGEHKITLDGNTGDIISRYSHGGSLREMFKFDAEHAALYLGGAGTQDGDVYVRDRHGRERIHLDGDTGDIKLSGGDCAEEFDVADTENVDPGTVLVIDDESKLRPCREAYDKKVAGVVSGANGTNPGIILDRNSSPSKRLPIALSGKVYCKVDASHSPIEIGDLLTTSPNVGHAMKAVDPMQAFGAVIGKAMATLCEGTGLIPILVALQ